MAVMENGWSHAGDYSDGSSASRHSGKRRSDWARLLSDLNANVYDVLILWEPSRGDRKPAEWINFLDECRTHNILIHVVMDDRTYNMTKVSDWKSLAHAGVDSAAETDLLSIRVKRGHAGAAAEGKPPGGPTPYGYRRTFDPATGKRTGQQPHAEEADVVREIFRRISRGQTILGLSNELNNRKVPRQGGHPWTPSAVRFIIRNSAYIAMRNFGGVEHRGTWEPLIDEATFYAARQILSAPERRLTRPGRQKHLLSYLATCAVCDRFINQVAGCYRCIAGCVSIPKASADLVVTETVLARLAEPDTAPITAQNNTDELDAAKADSAKLREQLDQWRASALRGETTPATLSVIEKGLAEQIAEAEERTRALQVPAPVRAFLGHAGDMQERWEAGAVVARRQVIAAVSEIKIGTGRRARRPFGVDELSWNLPRFGQSRWRGDGSTWSEILAR